MSLEVTKTFFNRVNHDVVKANVQITFNDVLQVYATIMNGSRGLFVAYKGDKVEKDGETKFYSSIRYSTEDHAKKINDYILDKYTEFDSGKFDTNKKEEAKTVHDQVEKQSADLKEIPEDEDIPF